MLTRSRRWESMFMYRPKMFPASSLKGEIISQFKLDEIRVPTPLLLRKELWNNLYCRLPEERKIFSISRVVSLLFNLRSERKIMSESRSIIDLILVLCLGQLVEIFRELQFWAEKERFWRTAARLSAEWAALGTELGDFRHLFLSRGLNLT